MGKPTFNYTVRVLGMKELLHILTPPTNLYGQPWKQGMEGLARYGKSVAEQVAPIGGPGDHGRGHPGFLKRHLKGAVQKSPLPKWVAIRSRGVRTAQFSQLIAKRKTTSRWPRGYPYPRLLEFSPKHHHQGWFEKIRGPIQGFADKVLSQISVGILERWSRG